MTLLLAAGGYNRQQLLDKSAACYAIRPETAFAPQHGRPQGDSVPLRVGARRGRVGRRPAVGATAWEPWPPLRGSPQRAAAQMANASR